MSIQVENITKHYHDFHALNDISLDIKTGELIALLGPSGSGKTTLLRIIAGLDHADQGRVLVNGEDTQTKRIQQRRVGFVFQHYALFRHMTVFENVAFGLRVRPAAERPSEYKIRRKVLQLLSMVHLDQFRDRYPHQLSGGQRQRVALARALAVEPNVLLLDEPFGALDAKVRKELRRWMRRLHDELHITSVFVTHDQEEAMEMADRVVVMSQGRIEQLGTPEEVYHQPKNAFVYDFLGNYNQFDGWQEDNGTIHLLPNEPSIPEAPEPPPQPGNWSQRYPGVTRLLSKIAPKLLNESPTFQLPTPRKRRAPEKGKAVTLFARPHEIFISLTRSPDYEWLDATVIHLNPAGALVKLELERPDGTLLQAEIPKNVIDELKVKKSSKLWIRPKQTKVFSETAS